MLTREDEIIEEVHFKDGGFITIGMPKKIVMREPGDTTNDQKLKYLGECFNKNGVVDFIKAVFTDKTSIYYPITNISSIVCGVYEEMCMPGKESKHD